MFRTLTMSAILLILSVVNVYSQDQPKKIALIVGISKYKQFPDGRNWSEIHGTNDIRYMNAALINQGFKPSDIDSLKDEQATKAGIVDAINRLKDRAEKNAIVVFHFSGHGQQICDNYQVDEWDGYDEALVPYDAREVRDKISDTGQFHFRDDELGDMLMEIRRKIGKGGSLLVLLDACYSGTATRGETVAIPRGSHIKFDANTCPKNLHRSGQRPKNEFLDDKEFFSNMVVISPVSADEKNFEVRDPEIQDSKFFMGSLTLAFTRAISQIKNKINYEILFAMIKTDIKAMNGTQNPMIEGDLKQEVLGDKYIPLGEFATVSWLTDTTVEIPRGVLQNVFEGSQFRLFPIDSTIVTEGTELASGVISSTTVTTSSGLINKAIKNRGNQLYKVVIDTRNFGEIGLLVRIDSLNKAMEDQVRKRLKTLNYVTIVEKSNADLSIRLHEDKKNKKQQLQLINAEGIILWQENKTDIKPARVLSNGVLDTIQLGIKNHAIAQFLRKVVIANDDPDLSQVRIEITPVRFKTGESGNCKVTVTEKLDLDKKKNAKGVPEFLECDSTIEINEGFTIFVKNGSDKEVYLSVLDITPLDEITVTEPKGSPDELKFLPNDSGRTCPIDLRQPYGTEHIKFLISTKPLDLKAIQQNALTRKATTSFEDFYNQTLHGDGSATKRWITPSVKKGEIRITPFVFNIVQRKPSKTSKG